MSPEGKPKPNLPENRPNASVPQTKLDAILSATRDRGASLRSRARELDRRARATPDPRLFAPALAGREVGVIAEVKRRSPSAGAIREDLDPVAHARAYVRGGAVSISVLTDELHFGGSLDDLAQVASAVPVPVLRKDFILDELQLYEARAAGASAVLLIVRALTSDGLRVLARAARDQGLGVLVEVHSVSELEPALGVDPTAVGVNSRDLATSDLDLGRAERLVGLVPGGVAVIADGGTATRADADRGAAPRRTGGSRGGGRLETRGPEPHGRAQDQQHAGAGLTRPPNGEAPHQRRNGGGTARGGHGHGVRAVRPRLRRVHG